MDHPNGCSGRGLEQGDGLSHGARGGAELGGYVDPAGKE